MMNLQHLHIHVRNRSIAEVFYVRWLKLRVARRGTNLTFMSDELGFDLALMSEAAPEKMPAWFHFGCKLSSADAVVALHDEMVAAGVPIARPLHQDQVFASFRAADPDGYKIEFYWEKPGTPLD
jgi:catechol 2,3-dioxygenase-like lactoylglutathione lyase family enzyme